MANHLPFAKKVLVLSWLVEGNSIRSTERITGVHRDTIMRLLVSAGEVAAQIHDIFMRELKLKKIQADEIWIFCGKKQKRLNDYEKNDPTKGDIYVFAALDSDTKVVPAYLVGKRNAITTYKFVKELALRVKNRFQLSTDAFTGYYDAIDRLFGAHVDYGQIVKYYGHDPSDERRYNPSKLLDITTKPLIGQPILELISTSHVESQNLTMRMSMRRFTRLTNAYSKKFNNLKTAVHLHFFHYNFIRYHHTLQGATPAMKAGITDTIWTWEHLLNLKELKMAA